MNDPFTQAEQNDPIWVIRGHSIQAYANLEQSLCLLLSRFSGMPLDLSGIIFFKITSSNVRDTILEKLLKKKHGNTYTVFWNSLQPILRQLAEKRNQIVHWNATTFLDANTGITIVALMLPNIWDADLDSTLRITTPDIIEFIKKCSFAGGLCNVFSSFLDPEQDKDWQTGPRQTWHDIFQQQVVYPPPNNHPLSQRMPILGSQLPPSPPSQ